MISSSFGPCFLAPAHFHSGHLRQLELLGRPDEIVDPVGEVEDGEDGREDDAGDDVDALGPLHGVGVRVEEGAAAAAAEVVRGGGGARVEDLGEEAAGGARQLWRTSLELMLLLLQVVVRVQGGLAAVAVGPVPQELNGSTTATASHERSLH